MKLNRNTTKTVARTVVGFCVGSTVATALRNNVIVEKKRDKALVTVGSYAAGGMASIASREWTDDTVDWVFDIIDSFQEMTK